MYEEEDITIKSNDKDTNCSRCGLRSYESECRNCGTPMTNKEDTKDEEDDNYNWREHKR
jgi:ribosomal protein L37E